MLNLGWQKDLGAGCTDIDNFFSPSALDDIGCTTARIIKNIKEKINGVDDIDGFEDLREEDQEKVKTAFEEGHGKQVQRIETQRLVC